MQNTPDTRVYSARPAREGRPRIYQPMQVVNQPASLATVEESGQP